MASATARSSHAPMCQRAAAAAAGVALATATEFFTAVSIVRSFSASPKTKTSSGATPR